VLEPDPLTQWALRAYLARWFTVQTADSVIMGQQIVAAQRVDAVVMSNELPAVGLAALEAEARRRRAEVTIVRTAAEPGPPSRDDPRVSYLEKPFELAQLARLLGVPETELPEHS